MRRLFDHCFLCHGCRTCITAAKSEFIEIKGNRLVLRIYKLVTFLARFVLPVIVQIRLRLGKEDSSRYHERFGDFGAKVSGSRSLLWLHAASVGESQIAMALGEHLQKNHPDHDILVTTQTKSSAQLIASALRKGFHHAYLPFDTDFYVRKFLDHWSPSLAIFVESEIWPNYLDQLKKRDIPIALINARMQDKSLRNWWKMKDLGYHIFGQFDYMHAASDSVSRSISAMGDVTVSRTGNLKSELVEWRVDKQLVERFSKSLSGRPVWLAASTHKGEEEIILKTHQRIRKEFPESLLIIAPRHPERAESICGMIEAHGFGYCQRSLNQMPSPDHAVYLADSLGEMALWYRLVSLTFLGGSLMPNIGGHNPFEPAKIGSALIVGPFDDNFKATYEGMQGHGALRRVKNQLDLEEAVLRLLTESCEIDLLVKNARAFLTKDDDGLVDNVVSDLSQLFMQEN